MTALVTVQFEPYFNGVSMTGNANSGRKPVLDEKGNRVNKPRGPGTGGKRGRSCPPPDSRVRSPIDNAFRSKVGARLTSAAAAAFETEREEVLIEGRSTEDFDEGDECNVKVHKKRVVPDAVRTQIDNVKRNIKVTTIYDHHDAHHS